MKVHVGLRALWTCFGLSAVMIVGGALLAIHASSRPFDWSRTVISALASRKHNPEGSVWFAGGLAIGLALLWPVTGAVSAGRSGTRPTARWAGVLLRSGLVCGMLVGAERMSFFHFSDLMHKGHEVLAVAAFSAIYVGELGLEFDHVRRRTSGAWMAVLVLLPLVAAAALLFLLYLAQRQVGWLDHDWSRDTLPMWGRFPFWQWIAVAALWAGLGHLLSLAQDTGRRPDRSPRSLGQGSRSHR